MHGDRKEAGQRKRLLLLMLRHQHQLFAYIYTLVPHRDAAEDLLQETSVVICEKFDQFEPGTDFMAWACQIAYWEIRRTRQKHARSKVIFNQELLEKISKTACEMTGELEHRHEMLARCLEKLPQRDREMILTRYEPGYGVKDAAERSGRTLQTAYKALSRIRKLLFDCVSHQLAIGEF